MGVLYHLRHPLLALDLIREHVAGDMLLFQTMQRGAEEVEPVPEDHPFHAPGTFDPPAIFDAPGYPRMHFIERHYAGDWTNWWAPNHAASEAMLRSAGFAIEARPEAEVYICRVAPVPFGDFTDQPMAAYPARAAAEWKKP
jgi:tRNA (mo5U34)-methyltransferase